MIKKVEDKVKRYYLKGTYFTSLLKLSRVV
jgi:hypothetical protein